MEKELVDYIIKRAIEQASVPITISIVDESGRLVALYRQPACSFFSLEVSRQKAVTASQLKMPTHTLAEISQKFPALQASLQANSDINLLPGGFPLFRGSRLIGGVGISGGNFEQDQMVGEKAAEIANY